MRESLVSTIDIRGNIHIETEGIMKGEEVVITAAIRSPIGSFGGVFREMRAPELAVPVMKALIDRTGIDPGIIDDVIWGCAYQRGRDEANIARVAAIRG